MLKDPPETEGKKQKLIFCSLWDKRKNSVFTHLVYFFGLVLKIYMYAGYLPK